jgi:transposase
MSEPAAIDPEYVAELERRLAVTEAEVARVTAQNTVLETANISLAEANSRLERMLAQARHARFGPSSEKGDPDQRNLFTEDIEVAEGQLAAAAETADKALGKTPRSKPPAKRNKGNLPDHLERVEEVIEPSSTLCPCGCGEMTKVGEDRTERLDVVPAQFRVLVTVRPKYMCRACDGKSHAQAPAPEFLVPRGLGTNRFAVHSVVAKFCDHLPFYRQAEIWRRDGIEIDRTMLANWAGRIAFHLAPIIDAMIDELKASDRLFADETTVPVLAPRTGKTRKDYLWAVVRDQRGWGGADPPIVVFQHSRSRGAETAKKIFTGFKGGALTVDGYAGYDALGDPKKTNRPWGITYCWTHWRRRFVEYNRTTESPICTEMTDRIGQLYRIEAEIRGKTPDVRRAIRQKLSKPIVDALRPWLEAQLDMLSSSSDLARHIRYGLKRWDGLTRFLDDGRVEMDTNAVENAIRPIPLTRKNALFAGNDDGAVTWARMASLVGTCKLNGINPQAYLEHVLDKILNGHMQENIRDLMPWNFKP